MKYAGLISSASVLVPVLCGIFTSRQPEWIRYKALFLFFSFTLLIEITADILARNNHSNNLWVYNIYNLVEGVFWTIILGWWMQIRNYLVGILCLSYAFIWFSSTVVSDSIFNFNTSIIIAENAILIPFSALVLLHLSKETVLPIYLIPEFWFSTALLFYCASTSVIRATATFLVHGENIMVFTWQLHSLFNIIANFMFAKAFLCIPRKMK